MFKHFMFGSFENFQVVILTCLMVWLILIIVTFVKALEFCRGAASPAGTSVTLNMVNPQLPEEKPSEIEQAMRITRFIAGALLALEFCMILLLLLCT